MRIHLLRRETYDLLAPAFRRPSPQQLEALTAEEAVGVFTEASEALPWSASDSGSTYLQLFVTEAKASGLAALADSLSLEYCRLFLGPYSLPSPPYGSVYLDGGQVMGASAFDVRSRYRQEGLQLAAAWAEPPDHIALELEFMAYLSARHSAATDAGQAEEAHRLLDAQRAFLRDHLGRWGPTFAERVRGATDCHLYRFLGVFLPEWLAFDGELLAALAGAEPQAESTNAHRRSH